MQENKFEELKAKLWIDVYTATLNHVFPEIAANRAVEIFTNTFGKKQEVRTEGVEL